MSSELAKLDQTQCLHKYHQSTAFREKTGADIDELSKALGMDHRIGPHF